jgi:hypothetical protein
MTLEERMRTRPCGRGHEGLRNKDGQCRDCRAEYGRIQYAKNPEKHRAYQRKRRAADPQRAREISTRASRKRRIEKPEEVRTHAREYGRAYRQKNRERVNASSRERRARNPEKHRKYNRDFWRKKNDIPLPLHAVPALCECCGRPPLGGRYRMLVPDHCHATKAPRGWLCGKCNVAIGLLGDDLLGLDQMRKYLLKYSAFAWMEEAK